jgi:hypothetical protein
MNVKTTCPKCGYEIDSHSPLTDPTVKPEPGNANICSNCYSLNKYNSKLELVQLTQEDLDSIPPELMLEIEMIIDKLKRNKNDN